MLQSPSHTEDLNLKILTRPATVTCLVSASDTAVVPKSCGALRAAVVRRNPHAEPLPPPRHRVRRLPSFARWRRNAHHHRRQSRSSPPRCLAQRGRELLPDSASWLRFWPPHAGCSPRCRPRYFRRARTTPEKLRGSPRAQPRGRHRLRAGRRDALRLVPVRPPSPRPLPLPSDAASHARPVDLPRWKAVERRPRQEGAA